MKKFHIILLSAVALFFVVTAFEINEQSPSYVPAGGDFAIPEDVQSILDKSCFGCHNVDAKSDKSKKKLMIDKLSGLSKAKLVGKLGEISEVVEANDMPPEKFLEKYPDKALTKEEAKILTQWADNAAEKLME